MSYKNNEIKIFAEKKNAQNKNSPKQNSTRTGQSKANDKDRPDLSFCQICHCHFLKLTQCDVEFPYIFCMWGPHKCRKNMKCYVGFLKICLFIFGQNTNNVGRHTSTRDIRWSSLAFSIFATFIKPHYKYTGDSER